MDQALRPQVIPTGAKEMNGHCGEASQAPAVDYTMLVSLSECEL